MSIALLAGAAAPHGDGTLFGALFESLVTLSVRVYAQACEARVNHLRTQGGEHEIDLIVERADGSVVALEVKLKAVIGDKDVRHLRWLGEQIGSRPALTALKAPGGRGSDPRGSDGRRSRPLGDPGFTPPTN